MLSLGHNLQKYRKRHNVDYFVLTGSKTPLFAPFYLVTVLTDNIRIENVQGVAQ